MIKREAMDATGIRAAVAGCSQRVEDEVRRALARIDAMESQLHAWEVLAGEFALDQARTLDRQIASGAAAGLLAGVPIAVKDIFDTADLPTGHGSPIYRGHRPTRDAWAVTAARNAGAIVMGKTVTTEFAYFTPGPTANPWDVRRTPGGSSSGSAAAVASGMVPLAFGSQTAGSLIRPASYCGVFALKPTHGLFPLDGVKPFAPSLDTLGWLARNANDLELMRCALSGDAFKPLDLPTSSSVRLVACQTHEWGSLDIGGQAVWHAGIRFLQSAGAQVRSVDAPASLAGLVEVQKTVMAFEAARSLAVEHRDQSTSLSKPILELIQRGHAITEPDYRAAKALTDAAKPAFALLLGDADALLVPAAPGEAPLGLSATGDPIFSRVWTLLGLPCVNVPGLHGPSGMPIGLQLVGRPGGERHLLSVAAAVGKVFTPSVATQQGSGR